MQDGDIDNRLPPRWLVVFEGVIGVHRTQVDRKWFEVYRRTGAWNRAVRTFQPDLHSIKVLWDLTWRREYKFDVVTYLGGKSGSHVQDWLDRFNVPAANVWQYDSPATLSQQLAFMPDVFYVVHGEPRNQFTYGDRGRLVGEGWSI